MQMEDLYMELERESQGGEKSHGNVSKILNIGLSMGKKIVVSGIVISSAPMILPPLVAVATIGFVCSVPYGLFLASYACTEQLLSKLLPYPTTPLSLQYETKDVDDDRGEEAEIGGDVSIEQEGPLEDTKQMAEMRLEPVLKGHMDEKLGDKNASAEENIYEDVDQEKLPKANYIKLMGAAEEQEKPVTAELREAADQVSAAMLVLQRDEGNGSNFEEQEVPFEVTSETVELIQVHAVEQNKELVRDTTGLLEKIRGEGKDDNGAQEEKQNVETLNAGEEEADQEVGWSAQETRAKNRNDSASIESSRRVVGQYVQKNGNEAISPQIEEVKEIVTSGPKEMQPIQVHDTISLLDDTKPVELQCSYEDYRMPEGSEQSCYEAYEVTFPTTTHESTSTGVTSEEDFNLAATKVLYDEDETWKQIHAIRKLVGYVAPVHSTYMEELKALYLFTGVEPPVSFKDRFDVYDKLRFLMTVIGVKVD